MCVRCLRGGLCDAAARAPVQDRAGVAHVEMTRKSVDQIYQNAFRSTSFHAAAAAFHSAGRYY